jgi:hypothetical protein
MGIKNALGVIFSMPLFSGSSVPATLIDNGTSTTDNATGLEWLDITLTVGQSYDSIIGGVGGFAAQGYVHATLTQLCGLWGTSGDILPGCQSETDRLPIPLPQATADLLTDLLGDPSNDWPKFSPATAGLYDSGLTHLGIMDLGCVNGGPLFAQCGSSDLIKALLGVFRSRGDPGVLSNWRTDQSATNVGQWLVRNIPEPPTIALLGAGLAVIGFGRRRKTQKPGFFD